MGSGHMTNRGLHGGAYAPAHYLKQFHPKYTAQADIDAIAAEEDVEDWIALFKIKNTWAFNPDLPILGPWRTVQPANTPNWTMERNPFYYEVDPEGNQLPYLDGIQMTLAENLEVLNLRAIAGEYDLQERHTDIAKLPVFLENMEQGNYSVHLDPGAYGSDATLQINHSYDADPEVAQWLQNADFRRALSMGIDRDQLNETFWLGVGSPGSVAPDPSSPQSPGEEWRTKWSTLDVEQANQLLDEIGLTEKDGEGFRMRSDGSGRLRLEVFAISGAFVPFPRIAQSIAQQWQDIGIQLDVSELERTLGFDPHAQQRAPDLHVGERWLGADLRLPASRAADRSGRGDDGPADRQLVRDQRRRGGGAERRGHACGVRPLQIGRRPEQGRKRQDRPGDLEDHRRQRLQHRHGWRVARGDGYPHRQEHDGQHPGAAGQHAARAHATELAPGDVLLQEFVTRVVLGSRTFRSARRPHPQRHPLRGYPAPRSGEKGVNSPSPVESGEGLG